MKFKPARLIPKLFYGVPFSGASYDLSTFSANTIAPYELGLDTSGETIVANFNGHVVSFHPHPNTSGCTCVFPTGLDGEMWYNSGGTWVHRDMTFRASNNVGDWFTLGGASSNQALSPTLYGGVIGGLLNTMSGTAASVIVGGYQHQMVGSITYGANVIAGGAGNSLINTRHCGTLGGTDNVINAVQRGAIMGGYNNLLTADGSVILGSSGLTGTSAYTVYCQKINVQQLLDLVPVTSLPPVTDGRVCYSANTGLMLCVGSTWKLITAV